MMFLKHPKGKRTVGVLALDRKLWNIFSRYIRLRDSDHGLGKCITCGRYIPVKEGDAGHFRNRRHKSTRFMEENVAFQCPNCNRFDEGKAYEFGKALDVKYGEGMADKITKLSGVSSKLDRLWYESAIKEYKLKLSQLIAKKGDPWTRS